MARGSDTASAAAPAAPQSEWSALMARAQDGDRDAYRTLLKQIEPYARAIARRCFRHPADVEDAVQDVLLTVHAVRHTYDPARPFKPWLAAVANHRIIDRLRRDTRRRAREIGLLPEHETFAQGETNSEANPDAMAERSLLEAIEKLPPEQRDAVRMLKLNEMSLKQAAQSSGRSVAALKVATHRALANLRKLLGGGGAS
ncbi:sigma-70 family RNA polymerase sigma factor [Bradyrhizobium sp.]|uniref:sigma-70 family RNA polymerase sigma factor n=1 Tax=Bradyrhizobium sp. TaxID=376 RepID=UPI003C56A621